MKTFLWSRHWLLVLCLLFVLSCHREDFITQPVSLSQSFTISAAREWTEDFVKADSNRNQPYSTRTLLWKQATMKRSPQGLDYVQIPIEEDPHTRRIIYDPASKDYVLAPKLQLVVYKLPAGNMGIAVMELAPSGEYAGSHQGFTGDHDFSGLQLVRTWQGKLIKGHKFENGKVTGVLSFYNTPSPKARMLSCTRWVHEYLYSAALPPMVQLQLWERQLTIPWAPIMLILPRLINRLHSVIKPVMETGHPMGPMNMKSAPLIQPMIRIIRHTPQILLILLIH